ncbi:hypothetical protein U9M48_044022 [Paspalum notatum var. saurae]|uniref:Uncharacterized protein n=1 Tax=Paspalum notatum var. saurae TaxID=547442 RepID=A0AAQ3XJ59_PASNO
MNRSTPLAWGREADVGTSMHDPKRSDESRTRRREAPTQGEICGDAERGEESKDKERRGGLRTGSTLQMKSASANSNIYAAMAAPPTAFENHLERWIFRHRIESVVSVEFRPKDSDLVLERLLFLSDVDVPEGSPEYHQMDDDSRASMLSTGVVAGENEQQVFVLTCAHSLKQVYNLHHPIDVADLADLYAPWIMCDHRELMFLARQDNERVSIEANISRLDIPNDLLLIEVNKANFTAYCNRPHPPVIFSSEFPSRFATVVMLSWPLRRHRTAVRGNISHSQRNIDDLAEENPEGLATVLSEVDITSDKGSSGAPLFDGLGKGIGLLYGGDGKFSYVIPTHVIRQCLLNWGWQYHG